MNDIPVGTYEGTGNLVYNEAYCVYRNGAGNYKVNITTDDAEFKVASTNASDEVAFTVRADDASAICIYKSNSYRYIFAIPLIKPLIRFVLQKHA